MSLPALFKLVKGQVPLVVELKGRPGEDDGFADAVVECLESYDGPVALDEFRRPAAA